MQNHNGHSSNLKVKYSDVCVVVSQIAVGKGLNFSKEADVSPLCSTKPTFNVELFKRVGYSNLIKQQKNQGTSIDEGS